MKEITLDFKTVFKCKKCGHTEPVLNDNNKPKEWLKHCGFICEMTVLRKLNLKP